MNGQSVGHGPNKSPDLSNYTVVMATVGTIVMIYFQLKSEMKSELWGKVHS
jgi:hypothetical protein